MWKPTPLRKSKQLIVVLRILLIDRARNQENRLEAGVLNSCAPASLPVWWLQNLTNAFYTFAFQISHKWSYRWILKWNNRRKTYSKTGHITQVTKHKFRRTNSTFHCSVTATQMSTLWLGIHVCGQLTVVILRFSTAWEVSVPNPCIVQGSTVIHIRLYHKSCIFTNLCHLLLARKME